MEHTKSYTIIYFDLHRHNTDRSNTRRILYGHCRFWFNRGSNACCKSM